MGNRAPVHRTIQNCPIYFQGVYPNSSARLPNHGVQAFNIKCNVTSEINHLNEGIRLGLQEDREKHSESLGRTAPWSGKASLSTLPAYLTIQIMRFYYKVATQQRAKIMRRVRISSLFPCVHLP